MRKAIFIDKDGTLIYDVPYNVNPELIQLEKNMLEGLRELQGRGYLLIVISNQSGVAQGRFNEDALETVRSRVRELLQKENIHLDGFYYCPHHPDGIMEGYNIECDCRKPKSGLILKAAADCKVDLSESWMIGDILNDIEAGNRAGCRTVLINNHHETEWYMDEFRKPTFIVKTINEAASKIIHAAPVLEK